LTLVDLTHNQGSNQRFPSLTKPTVCTTVSNTLTAYRPPQEFLAEVAKTKIKPARQQNFGSMVKENLEGFTKREVEDAMVARKLYHTSGCPTVDNLKMMICMNQIKNCPVTVTEDLGTGYWCLERQDDAPNTFQSETG
jgi:hypothetical protein